MRGKTCVEMETVKGRSCLCIRSVLIKNAHHKSLLGGKRKKRKPSSVQHKRFQRRGKPLELVNCNIHISGCILSSRILTVSITQLKKSASSYRMPLF